MFKKLNLKLNRSLFWFLVRPSELARLMIAQTCKVWDGSRDTACSCSMHYATLYFWRSKALSIFLSRSLFTSMSPRPLFTSMSPRPYNEINENSLVSKLSFIWEFYLIFIATLLSIDCWFHFIHCNHNHWSPFFSPFNHNHP